MSVWNIMAAPAAAPNVREHALGNLIVAPGELPSSDIAIEIALLPVKSGTAVGKPWELFQLSQSPAPYAAVVGLPGFGVALQTTKDCKTGLRNLTRHRTTPDKRTEGERHKH